MHKKHSKNLKKFQSIDNYKIHLFSFRLFLVSFPHASFQDKSYYENTAFLHKKLNNYAKKMVDKVLISEIKAETKLSNTSYNFHLRLILLK